MKKTGNSFTLTPKNIGMTLQSKGGFTPLEKSRSKRLKPRLSAERSLAGFTMIEALVYIALFAVIIGGGLLATYQVIEGTGRIEVRTIVEAEANFLLRKLDWALSGSSVAIPIPSSQGSTLTVQKGPDSYMFDLVDGVVEINGVKLTSGRVTVSDLTFIHTPQDSISGRPAVIEFLFFINGEQFGTSTRYIR